MEGGPTIKDYEDLIIQTSKEVDTIKSEKEQLACQHEQIKKALSQSNHQLQIKNKQLTQLKKAYEKLQREKGESDTIMKSSQYHRKALFDQMFASDKHMGPSKSAEIKQNLMDRLKQLNEELVEKNTSQLERLIRDRNNEISRLANQYNELVKQHIKSSNEYLQKISQLKQENSILKRNNKLKHDIEEELKHVRAQNHTQLTLTNRTLEQRLNILVQKLDERQKQIKLFKNQLKQSRRKEKELEIMLKKQRSLKFSEIPIGSEQIINMMNENLQLKNQLIEINDKYEKMVEQFPSIAQNQEWILGFMRKYQKLNEIQLSNQRQKADYQILKHKYDRMEQQNKRLISQIKVILAKNQGNLRYYKTINNMLNNYLIAINPSFEISRYNFAGLTEEQITELKQGKFQGANKIPEVQIKGLEYQLSKAQQQIQQNKKQLKKLNGDLDQKCKKLDKVEAENKKLADSLIYQKQQMHEPEQTFFESMLADFSSLQQERNSLKIQLRDREIKIIQLMVEITHLREKAEQNRTQASHLVLGSQIQFNICRPALLWININKDVSFFTQKLKSFETQIQAANKEYKFSLKQIKSQFQSQVMRLRQKLAKAEDEKKQLSNANHSAAIEPNIEEQQVQERVPINEGGSILDLGDHDLLHSQEQQPQNILSAESIQEINRLLSNHETNLKNLLEAYVGLKDKYQKLEQSYQSIDSNDLMQKMSRDLELSVVELKAIGVRLAQSDKNILYLEEQLSQKQKESAATNNSYKQQIANLNSIVLTLKKENQELRQENWYDKSTYSGRKDRKILFPEQVEYLVELVIQKNKELQMLKSKNQKMQAQQANQQTMHISENRNSEQMNSKQRQEINELLKDGDLLNVLEMAIARLTEQRASQSRMDDS